MAEESTSSWLRRLRGSSRAVLLVSAAALGAHPAAQEQPPRFRSAANVVEVDVRVFDEKGRFVETLTKDDFELTEDGVPQTLLDLQLILTHGESTGAAPVPRDPGPGSPQTWVFVFDTSHLAPAGLTRSRDAVRTFIRERFRDGDVAGIVADDRMLNNRLTSGRQELEAAVASLQPRDEATSRQLELGGWPRLLDEREALLIAANDRAALENAIARVCRDDPLECQKDIPVDDMIREKAMRVARRTEQATLSVLKMLNALCSGLARLAGPKTVVFLSDGFIVEQMPEAIQTAVGQAARAGARFYTIDTRGLGRGVDPKFDRETADIPDASGARIDARIDGTNALALDTGGIAIRNENNFGRALARIQQDAGTYYVLSYAPARDRWDGAYRTIGVRVTRAGVSIRARRGYLALEPARMLRAVSVTTANAPAAAATDMSLPHPASGLPLSALPAADIPTLPEANAAPPSLRARASAGVRVKELAATSDSGERAAPSRQAADGWAAYQRGDLAEASRMLGTAASEPGARPWVFYALGFAQLAEGGASDASKSWERVRALAPDFRPVYFDLADAHLRLSDEAAAVAVLREAERRWPGDAEVYNALGVVQLRRDALDEALTSFEKAVKAAPDESLGYFNLARAYQLRYLKTQRYSSTRQRWIGNESDLKNAAFNYERYIDIGGPYVQQARDAIASLAWMR